MMSNREIKILYTAIVILITTVFASWISYLELVSGPLLYVSALTAALTVFFAVGIVYEITKNGLPDFLQLNVGSVKLTLNVSLELNGGRNLAYSAA